MRTTTGLLLTAALLLPGAAQAQYGDPIPQIDTRTGFPIIHRGIPQGRGGIPDFLGGPFMPDDRGFPPGIRGIPGVPSIGDPFGRPAGVQFPPGAVAPYDPTARFRNPGGILPPSPAIPDIRNLPQITPPQVDYKFNVKPDLKLPPTSTSWQPWGCGSWSYFLPILIAAGAAAFRRRPSDDRK
jgi:hypothetical protein